MPVINKIVSTFGDHTSLVPMLVKDTANSAGMTAFSYKNNNDENEGKDRFIDEFGTMAIWLGGLPFFKGVFNKTAYKAAKLNPDIDIRLIKDKTQLKIAKEYAANISNKLSKPEILNTLNDAANKPGTFKNMFLAKFATATILSLSAFLALTKIRQNYRDKQYKKQTIEKLEKAAQLSNKNKKSFETPADKSTAFKGFINSNTVNADKNKKHVSFTGAAASTGKFLQDFMFDPVKNLFIMDLGIASERIKTSQTKTEAGEYAIKEASTIAFLYVIGRAIQKGIETIGDKLGKPIALHADVLSDKQFKNDITNSVVKKDVKDFLDIANKSIKDPNAKNEELFRFIYNSENANNIVIRTAKESGVLSTLSEKGNKTPKGLLSLNPHQYINPDKMVKHAENLGKVAENAPKNNLDNFMKSLTNLKRGSVAANMVISCLLLGVAVPLMMREYRKKNNNGSQKSTVQEKIEKAVENNFKAAQQLQKA